jgi:hypothetical protein
MSITNRVAPDDRAPRPNGHADDSALAEHTNVVPTEATQDAPAAGISARRASTKRSRARAGADDPHAVPNATAAAPPPACTARVDSAAPARVSKKNEGSHSRGRGSAAPRVDKPPLPPGELPLPEEGGDFVSAVHEKADVVEVVRRLLHSNDDKIIKGVLDRLLNLKYGNPEQSSDSDSGGLSIEGAPRPVRNRPQPLEQGT